MRRRDWIMLLPLILGNLVYFIYWFVHPELTQMQMLRKLWYIPVASIIVSFVLAYLSFTNDNRPPAESNRTE